MKTLLLTFFVAFASTCFGAVQRDSAKVELVHISPEPFHDFLKFEFAVHDTGMHEVKISIMNEQHDLVFMEKVLVLQGHEIITINTIDFHLPGTYVIKVKIDHKYQYLRKFKWVQ